MTQQSPPPINNDRSPFSIWWIAVPTVLLVTAIVMMRVVQLEPSSAQHSPAIGEPAPQLDLVRLTEEPVFDRLEKIPEGKVTLLHFWGTWCGPCKLEYPELARLANARASDPRFVFVSVSCEGGQGETLDGLWQKTRDYFVSQGIESLVFADPQRVTRRSAAERLQQNAMYYPTTIVVDADGTIAGVWEGYHPDAVGQMESLIDRLLATRGAAS